MDHKSTTELPLEAELSTSTAHTRAMKILWLDILVTCALAKVKVQPFEETPLSGIEKMWRVGYLGVTNTMQACLPQLRERHGKVINFGSGAGIGAAAGYASYGPVKEAVRAITRGATASGFPGSTPRVRPSPPHIAPRAPRCSSCSPCSSPARSR